MGEKMGPVCQSCGMPMAKEGDFGTEADGSKSGDYCVYCYQGGKFTNPDMTLEEMTNLSASIWARQSGMPEEQAREQLRPMQSQLKRWRKG